MRKVPTAFAVPWLSVIVYALVASLGCDDDDSARDAADVSFEAGGETGTDAAVDRAAGTDARDAAFGDFDRDAAIASLSPPDLGTLADASGDLVAQPLPADIAPPKRIVAGDVRLVGAGTSSCSNQVPASGNGDRWCAFSRAVANSTDIELWVVDVTAAAQGTPPACDGSSPLCLRLTTKLWTTEVLAGPAQSVAHKFDGDTLIFSAEGGSGPDGPYIGPVWAWRPGWSAARQLVARGFNCYGHYRVPLVECVHNVVLDGFYPREFDLAAGLVTDAVGPGVPTVDHARAFRSDGEQGFTMTFTDAGDAIIYSAPRADNPAVASLRVMNIGATGAMPTREILPDVLNWSLANDQKRVYYFAKYTGRMGTLMMADFPTGANPVQLAKRTPRYVVLGEDANDDRGIGYFIQGTGRFLSEYRVVPNRTAPNDSHVVFRYPGDLDAFRPSRDLRFTAYTKADDAYGYNAYVSFDGAGECMLSSARDRPGYVFRFLDHSGLVFWQEQSPLDPDFREGWVASPDGCREKRRFASRVGFYNAIRDQGLVFGDDYDNESVTLRYAKLDDGNSWPALGAVTVAAKVAMPIVQLEPQRTTLIFRTVGADAGLYLFAGLPFSP